MRATAVARSAGRPRVKPLPVFEGDPWTRQPGETQRAYELFVYYRDMPPDRRSLADLAKDQRSTVGSLRIISSRNAWVARCRFYDAHIARTSLDEFIAQIPATRVRDVEHGRELAELGLAVLRDMPREEIRAADAVKIFELGRKIERDALGLTDRAILDVNVQGALAIGVTVEALGASTTELVERARGLLAGAPGLLNHGDVLALLAEVVAPSGPGGLPVPPQLSGPSVVMGELAE